MPAPRPPRYAGTRPDIVRQPPRSRGDGGAPERRGSVRASLRIARGPICCARRAASCTGAKWSARLPRFPASPVRGTNGGGAGAA